MKAETPLVKELRDHAARETKSADNPFEARKLRMEWRAAAEIERLRDLMLCAFDALQIAEGYVRAAGWKEKSEPPYEPGKSCSDMAKVHEALAALQITGGIGARSQHD